MNTPVIVAGARTPIGRFMGGFGSVGAAHLGGVAIRGALERAEVAPDLVDYLVMGQVLQAGAGQNPARSAGLAGGLPASIPSITVNKVCLSGINAVAMAAQMIRTGEADVIVAGGMESMSGAPHLLRGSRSGFKYGEVPLIDHLAYDGLHDQATDQPMGSLAEQFNAERGNLTRAQQDEFAARSHQRAARAWKQGVFDDEVVPVTVARGASTEIIGSDEGIRPDTTSETLARLRPAFATDGTITAGSASQISDGAAAVVVTSKEKALEQGWSWLAEIVAHGMVAGPDSHMQMQPANAARDALGRAGMEPSDLDLLEVNEAFAAVAIQTARELGFDEERVNVNGGAIAMGHPLGMSGTRIVHTLALELARRGGGTGVAAICGGGGQGDALILRVAG